MAITTTYTCDRCGHSQDKLNQMWTVATFDGYYIWLYTDNGERKSERIAFEPETLAALVKFDSQCRNNPKKED